MTTIGPGAAAEILPEPGGTGGEAYEAMREMARGHGITLHGGSMVEDGGEKLFNTTVVFDAVGTEIARYRKIHLFDITAPDGTGDKYIADESYILVAAFRGDVMTGQRTASLTITCEGATCGELPDVCTNTASVVGVRVPDADVTWPPGA